jgi:hypothetical protein
MGCGWHPIFLNMGGVEERSAWTTHICRRLLTVVFQDRVRLQLLHAPPCLATGSSASSTYECLYHDPYALEFFGRLEKLNSLSLLVGHIRGADGAYCNGKMCAFIEYRDSRRKGDSEKDGDRTRRQKVNRRVHYEMFRWAVVLYLKITEFLSKHDGMGPSLFKRYAHSAGPGEVVLTAANRVSSSPLSSGWGN